MSIVLENVNYVYSAGTPYEKKALQDINLTINEGEFVGIIGHTGSGKSTLVQHLNGLISPTEGRVTVDGQDIAAKTEEARAARHKVGMVFQYPEHQLFEETIKEDIAFGPKNLGMTESEIDERVRKAMDFVNLDYETYAERSPFQLSGGQMRRVAIAGTMALAPKFLVLDEPSAGLDPFGREAIFRNIMDLHAKKAATVVLVSHNMEDISRMAQRVIVMHEGKILLDDKPMDIFLHHQDELALAGVEVPPVSVLMEHLYKRGFLANREVLSIDDAVASILRKLKEEHHA